MKGRIYKRRNTWSCMVDFGRDPISKKRKCLSRNGFKTAAQAKAALYQLANMK